MKGTTEIVNGRLLGKIGNAIFDDVHLHWYYAMGIGELHRVLEWTVWEDTDQLEHGERNSLKDRIPGQLEAFLQELGAVGDQGRSGA